MLLKFSGAKAENKTMWHPFDDPKIIRRTGSVGSWKYWIRQKKPIDYVFVAVGWWRFARAFLAVFKTLFAPIQKIIGVGPRVPHP